MSVRFRWTAFSICVLGGAGAARANGLVCLHWHTAKADLVDSSRPMGQRGWDVETILDVNDGPGSWTFDATKSASLAAKAAGLQVIMRIDYNATDTVPKSSSEHKQWADAFIQRTNDLAGVTTLFVVGNEPPLGGQISAAQYVAAFNQLHARKSEMPAGTRLLAAGPNFHCCPWVDGLTWLDDMSAALADVDGFALHTYHAPGECGPDPGTPCEKVASWPGDDGFRNYRDQIEVTRKKWPNRPVYLTETNTDTNGLGLSPDPQDNYPDGWFPKAYADIRDYNSTTASDPAYPQVLALCWFVDRNQAPWAPFSLEAGQGKMAIARQDFIAAAHDPQNYVIPAKPDAGPRDGGGPPDAPAPDHPSTHDLGPGHEAGAYHSDAAGESDGCGCAVGHPPNSPACALWGLMACFVVARRARARL